ncbi:hypothetical protein [Protofrankia symbiont of Coriaria ruscifolia]|uniref:hypothetical protein n=1 Tax=Protofrankia symbiont of Coriaria ruscifolia TaxID=1306542 RepID=UPI00104150C4|nr:hypothetical protein [Protofrankia symbiont of Coriaria ruscifolia]
MTISTQLPTQFESAGSALATVRAPGAGRAISLTRVHLTGGLGSEYHITVHAGLGAVDLRDFLGYLPAGAVLTWVDQGPERTTLTFTAWASAAESTS